MRDRVWKIGATVLVVLGLYSGFFIHRSVFFSAQVSEEHDSDDGNGAPRAKKNCSDEGGSDEKNIRGTGEAEGRSRKQTIEAAKQKSLRDAEKQCERTKLSVGECPGYCTDKTRQTFHPNPRGTFAEIPCKNQEKGKHCYRATVKGVCTKVRVCGAKEDSGKKTKLTLTIDPKQPAINAVVTITATIRSSEPVHKGRVTFTFNKGAYRESVNVQQGEAVLRVKVDPEDVGSVHVEAAYDGGGLFSKRSGNRGGLPPRWIVHPA